MTTITTDMLRSIAHTLGASVDYTREVLSSEFDTDIDDTPADETEQTMAMTITQTDLRRIPGADKLSDAELVAFAQYFGYIITPAEPPAEMVKLAREIVFRMSGGFSFAEDDAAMRAALAALQHAVDVVAHEQRHGSDSPVAVCSAILTALGAGGRDAA